MKNVIIWGMGGYYQSRKGWIPNEYNILAFIHGDPEYCGTYFEGKRVILPVQVNQYQYDLILIAVDKEKQLIKQLIELGISNEKIEKLVFSSDMIYRGKERLPLNRPEIRLFYYAYPNIGDILNAFMLDKLFQIKVVKSDYQDADLIAIGSLLDSLLTEKKDLLEQDYNRLQDSEIHIWGTGLMYEYTEERSFLRPMKIHALRGELTRELVSRMLGYEVDCTLADPGLLASLVYHGDEKKYEVGIIPHYVDYGENIFYDLQRHYQNAIIIDVKDYPLKVLQQISQCKCIISTSLHGLIIADSYGIPNQWCVYSDKVLGNGFKFRDYYSSFNLEIKPCILEESVFPNIDDIVEKYSISSEQVKQKQRMLIECFPEVVG